MPNPKFQFQMQTNKDAGMQIVCKIELLSSVSSVMESLLWWFNISSKKIIIICSCIFLCLWHRTLCFNNCRLKSSLQHSTYNFASLLAIEWKCGIFIFRLIGLSGRGKKVFLWNPGGGWARKRNEKEHVTLKTFFTKKHCF